MNANRIARYCFARVRRACWSLLYLLLLGGLLDTCAHTGMQYPTDPQCQTAVTKARPDCFAEKVLAAQSHAAAADPPLPFFITEYKGFDIILFEGGGAHPSLFIGPTPSLMRCALCLTG